MSAVSTKPVAKENEHLKKLQTILLGLGYRRMWSEKISNFTLECWFGDRGTLMIQGWADAGVEIYHASGVPCDWSELTKWLVVTAATA